MKTIKDTNLMEGISHLCESIAGKPIRSDQQIISGWAEVEVNGIEYQAQLVLEPRKTHYTDEKIISVREIEEEELLKIDVKF